MPFVLYLNAAVASLIEQKHINKGQLCIGIAAYKIFTALLNSKIRI